MYSTLSPYASKFLGIPLLAIFCAISCFSQTSLEAGGISWGKTEETSTYEESSWNAVYCNIDNLKFVASIPNYRSGILYNGMIAIQGKIEENISYTIQTSFQPNFKSDKTAKKFAKRVQDANPTYSIHIVPSQGSEIKYIVDLIPTDQNNRVFWRFLSTNNRLIKMGTDDTNENRRLYFFSSFHAKNSKK